MARAKAILQSEFPYNISARCINREWFQVPMEQVWQIFCEELTLTIQEHDLRVHSFILMSNHFHLIASTPNANISQCIHQFMTRSSRRLTRAGNRINQTFSGRHYKCVLAEGNYYLNAYKYNYRNPVTAGICQLAEEDPFSTLQWLNTTPDPAKLEAVRYGLKRSYFKFKKCKKTHRPLMNINDIL